MMDFLANYGLFLAKTVTLVVALLVVTGSIIATRVKGRERQGGHIEVRHLNRKVDEMKETLEEAVLDKSALKQAAKAEKARLKTEKKAKKQAAKSASTDPDSAKEATDTKKRLYVLDFNGDIKASATQHLREEITAVLAVAQQNDEIVLRLESAGGMVHAYGLAASELARIKARQIALTVCVDKVAASGGYLMACLGDKILAAPFAILGSIGVLAQLPNFHRLLKKHDIDFELLTAGEYKRTLTMLGENTEKGRKKFIEDLEDTHELFKSFVSEQRPALDIERVATGEIWFGRRALEQALIDAVETSDTYLIEACQHADVYEVKYIEKKTLQQRLAVSMESALDKVLLKWWGRLFERQYY